MYPALHTLHILILTCTHLNNIFFIRVFRFNKPRLTLHWEIIPIIYIGFECTLFEIFFENSLLCWLFRWFFSFVVVVKLFEDISFRLFDLWWIVGRNIGGESTLALLLFFNLVSLPVEISLGVLTLELQAILKGDDCSLSKIALLRT